MRIQHFVAQTHWPQVIFMLTQEKPQEMLRHLQLNQTAFFRTNSCGSSSFWLFTQRIFKKITDCPLKITILFFLSHSFLDRKTRAKFANAIFKQIKFSAALLNFKF